MNKKKIIKIVSVILGVVVFIFICNQVGEILDNRRVRLEVEKDRAERQEKKEAGSMTEFLESLKEMGYQKESIFNETYDYETTVNEKKIRVWYLVVGAFEIPIIGTRGSKYEYSTDFMCKHKYLNIDDETVYSEDWTSNKEEQKTSENNYSSPSSGSSSSSHSRYNSDPYDVEDYNDPDDFAEEWAEKFGDGSYDDGYDDAYDYWESERD